jgi:hypothetical protein
VRVIRPVFCVLLLGCVAPSAESNAGAPLIGVDGSVDSADHGCHVVLRGLQRNWTGFGYETVGSSWVWQGAIEISQEAASEGLVPALMFRMAPSGPWRAVAATPLAAAPTPGYVAFDARISEDLPGPGWSGTALANARIEVVPYLAMPEGGRLFDHNRNTSDFANYEMTSPDFAVWHNDAICTPPDGPAHATVVFSASWTQHRHGILAPGGDMTIAYDLARAPCKSFQNGLPQFDVTAYAKFSPGNQLRTVSVRSGAATIPVPSDARGVALWFENTDVHGCHEWDSNFGNNYWFDCLLPPQWIGDAGSLISRGASDPCNGATSARSGFAYDTWARQRADVTNLCFQVYQPGLTDHDDPDLWQKLDVSLHWRHPGQTAFHVQPVNFDRRVGNNARYAQSWRSLDPYRPYHCPEVAGTPSGDGQYASIAVEYYIAVNGAELRPEPGAAFGGTFTDYAHDAWRDANCP